MTSDIEIEVAEAGGPGEYVARVLRADVGGAPHLTSQLPVDEMLSRREQLEQTVLASSVPARRRVSAAELPVRELVTAMR